MTQVTYYCKKCYKPFPSVKDRDEHEKDCQEMYCLTVNRYTAGDFRVSKRRIFENEETLKDDNGNKIKLLDCARDLSGAMTEYSVYCLKKDIEHAFNLLTEYTLRFLDDEAKKDFLADAKKFVDRGYSI